MERFVVQPDDERLDAFDSGNPEVDGYFKQRRWFSSKSGKTINPTYGYVATKGEVVGFCACRFKKTPHPRDDSHETAKYLTIYAIGVNRSFQGVENPESGKSYAATILADVEALAREKDGCRGLSLWVRTDNPRAIRCYERFGFEADPGGPIQRDDKAPHLTMRKVF